MHLHGDDLHRTVYIDNKGVVTTDFDCCPFLIPIYNLITLISINELNDNYNFSRQMVILVILDI